MPFYLSYKERVICAVPNVREKLNDAESVLGTMAVAVRGVAVVVITSVCASIGKNQQRSSVVVVMKKTAVVILASVT